MLKKIRKWKGEKEREKEKILGPSVKRVRSREKVKVFFSPRNMEQLCSGIKLLMPLMASKNVQTVLHTILTVSFSLFLSLFSVSLFSLFHTLWFWTLAKIKQKRVKGRGREGEKLKEKKEWESKKVRESERRSLKKDNGSNDF